MAGEAWRQSWQVGKESVEGTAVAAARKLYVGGDSKYHRPEKIIKLANGSRSNTVAVRQMAPVTSADLTGTLSADEFLEVLLGTMQGSVTPTTALGQSTHVFTPASNAVDPFTLEQQDGYNAWALNGCKGNSFKISGTAEGDNTYTWNVWARDRVARALTGSLTDRTPQYIMGWETKFYLDAFGAAPGTTAAAFLASAWEINFDNHLDRKVFAANAATVSALPTAGVDATGTLTLEGDAAGLAQYTNWLASTPIMLRAEFGNNGTNIGTSAIKPRLMFDIATAWTAIDFTPENHATKVYKLSWTAINDPTNGYQIRATVNTARTAGWV